MSLQDRSERLVNTYGLDWWEKISHELERSYAWVLPGEWQGVVSWILERCNMSPRPAKFKEAIEALRIRRDGESSDCPKCHGARYYRVYRRHIRSGKMGTAAAPCETCNMPMMPREELLARADKEAEQWEMIDANQFHGCNVDGDVDLKRHPKFKARDGGPRPVGDFVKQAEPDPASVAEPVIDDDVGF